MESSGWVRFVFPNINQATNVVLMGIKHEVVFGFLNVPVDSAELILNCQRQDKSNELVLYLVF